MYTGPYKANQINEYVVYESPDGGRTVYKRKSGQVERVLHSIDPALEAEILRERERNEWMDIFNTAERVPALQEAMDRVKILYELSKDSKTLPPDWHPV
jgi:hypothetical protein